ncbi:hypothetical protein JW964_04535 [candidate division KSB1 bacterium]|nr:hypothetical protein [candidate division KSB1 bacterium]
MKSLSKIAPYNKCDYRCESCVHIRECKLFRNEIGEQLKHESKLEDIDSVLTNIHKTIFETISMLQQKAKELGLNMEKIEDEDPGKRIDLEAIPLYRLGHDFSLASFQFLQKLSKTRMPIVKIQRLKPEIEDLSWYHTIVSTKIARALTSQADGDEFGFEDAKNSASVARSAVNICLVALENLLEHLPDFYNDLAYLLKVCLQLDDGIDKQFGYLLNLID